MRNSIRGGMSLLAPPLLYISLFFILPLVLLLWESFREYTPGRVGSVEGAPLTLQNYAELISPAYLIYFIDTFRIALIATLVSILLAYVIAYHVARSASPLRRKAWFCLMIAMVFLSAMARVYSIALTFGPVGLSPFLSSLLSVNPNSGVMAETIVILGLMHYLIPIAVLPLISTIQNVNPRLADAAVSLGASRLYAHLSITVPLSVRGLVSAFLISYTLCIGAFVIPMILGKGRVTFVSNLIYTRFSQVANYPSGAAISIVTLVIVVLLAYAVGRYFGRNDETEGPVAKSEVAPQPPASPLSAANAGAGDGWKAASTPRGLRRIDQAGATLAAVSRWATVVFLLAPIVVAIGMSFDSRPFLASFPPPSFSMRWYVRFFTDPFFLNGLRTSLLVAVLTAVISTILGVAAAMAIDRYRFPGREALMTLLLAPAAIPAVVTGFGLLLIWSQLGVAGGFARLLSGHVVITLPYTIRAVLSGLGGINRHCLDAAACLGANGWRSFLDITLPLAKTGIVAGAIFAFALSLDDVAVSLFLTDSDIYTLPVVLVNMMRASFDLTVAAAAVILVAATILIILVLERAVGVDRLVGQGIYRT